MSDESFIKPLAVQAGGLSPAGELEGVGRHPGCWP